MPYLNIFQVNKNTAVAVEKAGRIVAEVGCAPKYTAKRGQQVKGRSIEERPAIVNAGTEVGYWEVASVDTPLHLCMECVKYRINMI